MAKEIDKVAIKILAPVTVKDFKPGQEVYALYEEKGRNTEDKVIRLTVVSVGRKYVKAAPYDTPHSRDVKEYYSLDDEREYLTENKDWGYKQKLFPSKESMDKYCLKKDLYDRLSKRFYLGIESFMLAELQAVENALNKAKSNKEAGECHNKIFEEKVHVV